jgi:hypothetical protein
LARRTLLCVEHRRKPAKEVQIRSKERQKRGFGGSFVVLVSTVLAKTGLLVLEDSPPVPCSCQTVAFGLPI